MSRIIVIYATKGKCSFQANLCYILNLTKFPRQQGQKTLKIDLKMTLWCDQFTLANGVETSSSLAGL